MNASFQRALYAITLAAAAAAAPAQRALLLTPSTDETTRSGSNGTSLAVLRYHGIGVVTPDAANPYSAETFAHHLAIQTLAGDEDGDGDVHTPGLTGGIDALLVTPWDFDPLQGFRPRQRPVTLADVYFSPKTDVGTNVSGAPGLRQGDVGRFTRIGAANGQVERFISAEQLIAALGMFDPATNQPLNAPAIDVDGITVSIDRDIFVTFDADHALRLRLGPPPGVLTNFVLQDGAIAVIPAAAWTPNTLGNVGAVTPGRGMIALTEANVNALLGAAMATNVAGACVNTTTDTEDVAIDIDGGTFQVTWGGMLYTFADLLLGSENLTGCGVVTTRGGGAIAQVNGRALATPCGVGPTVGPQMGMAASATMGWLAGLESVAKTPFWFTLGSPAARPLGGPVQVEVGTNLSAPAALVGLGLGVLPVSPSLPVGPWGAGNLGFPELYPAIVGNPLFLVPLAPGAGAARFGVLTFGASPVIPQGVLFQALALTPGNLLHLSTPETLH